MESGERHILDKKRKKLFFILRVTVALSAVALIFIFGEWNFSEIASSFRRIDPLAFVASLCFFVLANTAISIRWYILLRTQTTEIPYITCLKIHFLGLFYNNILVSSLGGDILRMWYIAHHSSRRIETAFSVIMDRLMGLIGLTFLVVVVYWLIPMEGQNGRISISPNFNVVQKISDYRMLLILFGLIAILVMGLLFSFARFRRFLADFLRPIIIHLVQISRAIRVYATVPWTLLYAILLTLIAQSLPIYGFWMIGSSMGLTVPIRVYFLFFPLSWAVGALPISIGGLGIVEGGLVYLFTCLPGVTMQSALLLALCQRLTYLIGSIPGIFVHLSGIHLPRDISIEQEFFVDETANK